MSCDTIGTTRRGLAIIPARGGSKRIARKNLLMLAGRPLVAHSIEHALRAGSVGDVVVSTDDPDIASVAAAAGAGVSQRPAALAGDAVTSEAVLLHVLDERRQAGNEDPDFVVFLQPTSPIRRPDDIDRAVEQFVRSGCDSLFSACENQRLIWAVKDGQPFSLTYDYTRRQREQDMALQYRENGSIYVFKPAVLRQYGNRLGGRIDVFVMDYWSSFQIDTPEHVELCRWVLAREEFRPAIAWPEPIGLVVFDFDGVMTENGVWIDESGGELVRCNRGDGWGLNRLKRLGVPLLVITTEERPLAVRRCAKLGVPCAHGVPDKAAYLREYLVSRSIDPATIVYVGNDENDLEAMKSVGLPVAVADAEPNVRAAAGLTLTKRGGFGAVRELCDLLTAHLSRPTEAV